MFRRIMLTLLLTLALFTPLAVQAEILPGTEHTKKSTGICRTATVVVAHADAGFVRYNYWDAVGNLQPLDFYLPEPVTLGLFYRVVELPAPAYHNDVEVLLTGWHTAGIFFTDCL